MTISGTQTFNLEVVDLIEEAYERAGLKLESGYDYRTGKRSIDLLMLEWQNRNIDIWMVEEAQWSATYPASNNFQPANGQIDFTLDLGTVDVLDVIIRKGTSTGSPSTEFNTEFVDSRLRRIPERNYASISAKLTTGEPDSYYLKTLEILDISAGANQNAVISVYPAVDTGITYNLLYWRTKRIADMTSATNTTGANTVEVPGQYLPALVAGLAYGVGMKHGEVGGRIAALKTDYDEQIMLLGKMASPNNEGHTVVPVQQQPAPQQYPMVRGRDGQVRISRSAGRRRM